MSPYYPMQTNCKFILAIHVVSMLMVIGVPTRIFSADNPGRNPRPEMKIRDTGIIAVVRDASIVSVETRRVDGKLKTILRVIDLKTAKTVDVDGGFGLVSAAAASRDGAAIAIGRRDSNVHFVQIWDWTTRRLRTTARVNGNNFVVFDPNGKYVYTAERLGNGVVDRVDVATGRVEQVFGPRSQVHVDRSPSLYGQQIRSLDTVPGGKELFIAMPLGAVVWDLASGRERSFVTTHQHKVAHSIAINHVGTQVAMPVVDGVRIVDIRTREKVAELTWGRNNLGFGSTHLLAFSPDDKLLVGTLDGGIGAPSYLVLWRGNSYKSSIVFHCHDSSILELRFIAGTNRLVTGSEDGVMCVWNLDQVQ